uniref:Uncharacterized protein n=1 Tax=Candidatus Kentrum sp. LPFa TaxID=2126335 RepID=A0A450W126_9GAMM|nr:MAG: hypothetical protein BECKLPF1236B_GA0070989_101519 [Candidatus Kentron sp. LPFa]
MSGCIDIVETKVLGFGLAWLGNNNPCRENKPITPNPVKPEPKKPAPAQGTPRLKPIATRYPLNPAKPEPKIFVHYSPVIPLISGNPVTNISLIFLDRFAEDFLDNGIKNIVEREAFGFMFSNARSNLRLILEYVEWMRPIARVFLRCIRSLDRYDRSDPRLYRPWQPIRLARGWRRRVDRSP